MSISCLYHVYIMFQVNNNMLPVVSISAHCRVRLQDGRGPAAAGRESSGGPRIRSNETTLARFGAIFCSFYNDTSIQSWSFSSRCCWMLTLVSFFQHQTWQLTEEQLLWVNWLLALNSSSGIFPLLPLLIHSICEHFARFFVFFCCCFVFFSVIEWVLLNVDIYDHATSCSSSFNIASKTW